MPGVMEIGHIVRTPDPEAAPDNKKESEALPGRQADLHVDAPARVGV